MPVTTTRLPITLPINPYQFAKKKGSRNHAGQLPEMVAAV
jgi:hypothetical protein